MLNLFRGNKNIYLHFMPFLHIDMTQVVEILPQVRPGYTYSTQSISWLLVPWRRKEPGHQQPWYWPSLTEITRSPHLNTLRPRQNGGHFADDIFKRIFLNEIIWITIKISLKFVPRGSINNIPALVQIMAWRRPGDKPLPEPMMVNLPMHICVTRPQWVKV